MCGVSGMSAHSCVHAAEHWTFIINSNYVRHPFSHMNQRFQIVRQSWALIIDDINCGIILLRYLTELSNRHALLVCLDQRD